MHVLLIENVSAIGERKWGDLKRLGRVHFDVDLGGQPEVYLEPPHPRRQTLTEYKAMLAGQGLKVAGAYRGHPTYDVELPVLTLRIGQYGFDRVGRVMGDYANCYTSETPCPWCTDGHLNAVHEIGGLSSTNNGDSIQVWKTVLFCPECRKLVKFIGKWGREEWTHLAEYVARAPRAEAIHTNQAAAGDRYMRGLIANLSPAKKRMLGIGGVPKPKGLAEQAAGWAV